MIPVLPHRFANAFRPLRPGLQPGGRTGQADPGQPLAPMPFRAARQQYSLAVKAGLQPNSMLAYREHFKTLDQLEKVTRAVRAPDLRRAPAPAGVRSAQQQRQPRLWRRQADRYAIR